MTCNNHSINSRYIFSQKQLEVVENIPENFIPHQLSIRVVLVPPSVRDISAVSNNWSRIEVRSRESIPTLVYMYFIYGRRIQYPLKPNLSSTLHSVIGKTVLNIAMQVSHDKEFMM